jgi:hypothetical protein
MRSNLVSAVALAAVGGILASIEPALAGAGSVVVPAPVVAAGLPALAILGGGYWLIRKIRERR